MVLHDPDKKLVHHYRNLVVILRSLADHRRKPSRRQWQAWKSGSLGESQTTERVGSHPRWIRFLMGHHAAALIASLVKLCRNSTCGKGSGASKPAGRDQLDQSKDGGESSSVYGYEGQNVSR